MSEENTKKTETEKPVSKEKDSAKVPAKFKDIVSKVEEMSVIELNELVKILEEKFDVSAVAAVAGPVQDAESKENQEEKNAYTVELTDSGEQKIAIMKIVKEVLVLGLKEAKDLVDGAPSILKEGMKKGEAEEFKKRIEEAGGKITLK